MAFYITPRLRLCHISNCTYSLQLEPNNAPHVAVVVSPLGSLMVDQLQRCADMNVKAIMVNRATEVSAEEKTGLHTVVMLLFTIRPME